MRYRYCVGAALLAASLALGARVAHSQTLATDALRVTGTRAYNRLPTNVTLRDAPLFSVALRYLYAYEQRALREGDHRVDSGAEAALDWLSARIENMKTAKADEFRNDDNLRDRGLAMYEKAKDSEQANQIWDVRAYLSASANLFAYSQIVPNPGDEVREASQWLLEARARLVKSGLAGDRPGADPEAWLPSGTRPGMGRPVIVGPPPGLGSRPGAGALAGRTVAPGVVGNPATTDTARPRPVPIDSVQPVPAAPDDPAKVEIGKLIAKGNLREALDRARSILAANPSDGDAHFALALIYSQGRGERTTPEDRAVLWLAIDHLTIAIKTGAIGYELGQKILQDLESKMPTADDLKARGWITGQRLRINFPPYEWIDEETTIRPRKE